MSDAKIPIIPAQFWNNAVGNLRPNCPFMDLNRYRMYRRTGAPVNGVTIPQLVTAKTIGDATGYVSPCREFAYGYRCGSAEWSQHILPQYRYSGTGQLPSSFIYSKLPDYLGASIKLDYIHPLDAGSSIAEDRDVVQHSGGGDYYLSNRHAGYDVVLAQSGVPGHLIIIGHWSSGRVWIGFFHTFTKGGSPALNWSGLAGYGGEWAQIFNEELWPGNYPPRVFVELLLERKKLPPCLVPTALASGFTPERNV